MAFKIDDTRRFGEIDYSWDYGGMAYSRQFEAAMYGPDGIGMDTRRDPGADPHDPLESIYWRPKDLEAARQWVRNNVEAEGNRDLLLTLLARMEGEPDLWLYTSC